MLKTDTNETDSPVVLDGYEYETPRVPWRAVTVEALSGYRLHVTFRDGVNGEVDLSERVMREDSGLFHTLEDRASFEDVSVVFGAVTWGNGIDLAPDAMHDEIERNGVWILR